MITKQYDLKKGNEKFKGLLFSPMYNQAVENSEKMGFIKQIKNLKISHNKIPYSILYGHGSVAELEERERAVVQITGADETTVDMLKGNIELILNEELILFNPLNYKEYSK